MALQLLLADDDEDDCLFFKEALEELLVATHLTTVQDGEQLMQWLTTNKHRATARCPIPRSEYAPQRWL